MIKQQLFIYIWLFTYSSLLQCAAAETVSEMTEEALITTLTKAFASSDLSGDSAAVQTTTKNPAVSTFTDGTFNRRLEEMIAIFPDPVKETLRNLFYQIANTKSADGAPLEKNKRRHLQNRTANRQQAEELAFEYIEKKIKDLEKKLISML